MSGTTVIDLICSGSVTRVGAECRIRYDLVI